MTPPGPGLAATRTFDGIVNPLLPEDEKYAEGRYAHTLKTFDEMNLNHDSVARIAINYLREVARYPEWNPPGLAVANGIIYGLFQIAPLKEAFLRKDLGV